MQRHDQAELLDHFTLRTIDRRPAASEHEPATNGGEGDRHQDEQRPRQRGHLVRVADGNEAGKVEKEKHADDEEREAESGHAAAALTDLQSIGCHQLEWPVHRCVLSAVRRPMKSAFRSYTVSSCFSFCRSPMAMSTSPSSRRTSACGLNSMPPSFR